MGETSFPAGGGLRRLLVSVSDWREVAANYLGEPPHGRPRKMSPWESRWSC